MSSSKMANQSTPHDPATKQPLLDALSTLTLTLHTISALPTTSNVEFTAVDRALLDAMNQCVSVLLVRHSSASKEETSDSVEEEDVERGDEEERTKRKEDLDKLNDLVTELVLSVSLLGSTWEVEMGESGVVEIEDEEEKEETKSTEEDWVDVSKGDVVEKEKEGSDATTGDKANTAPEDDEEEKDNLLPPLSPERKDEILENISTTTTSILSTIQALHTSSSPPVEIEDFLGNTYTLPSHNLFAQIKARYTSGPGATHIQNGYFELLDFEDRKTVISTKNRDWSTHKKLLLVAVLGELPDVGKGCCPMPACEGLEGKVVKEGGWVCKECGVWFDHASPFSKQDETVLHGKQASYIVEKKKSWPSLKALPYNLWSTTQTQEQNAIFKFKYVKMYDLITLGGPGSEIEEGKYFKCKKCTTHLASYQDISSRNFRGHHGKAYLFTSAVNVLRGGTTTRNMTTGKHEVCDIYCRQCGSCVGWGYEGAHEASERYKVGKVILELELLVDENGEKAVGKKEKERAVPEPWRPVSEHSLAFLQRIQTVKGELGKEDMDELLRVAEEEGRALNREMQGRK